MIESNEQYEAFADLLIFLGKLSLKVETAQKALEDTYREYASCDACRLSPEECVCCKITMTKTLTWSGLKI